MNSCRSEPGDYSAQPKSTCLKDRESRSDNGHIASIEIPERWGGWLTKQALSDAPAGVLALLNRHLGDARQWLRDTRTTADAKLYNARRNASSFDIAVVQGDAVQFVN